MSLAVIGATSVIGRETAKVFYRAGHNLLLISRDTRSIDLTDFGEGISGPSITCLDCDISRSDNIEAMADRIIEFLDDDPYLLLAAGTIGTLGEYSGRLANVLEIIDVNFRNVAAAVALVAAELRQRKKGCVIVLSSVAGDRGRQSNLIYGSSKAGLSVFAQGLRNQLFRSGVHVMTVKLGYVDTPMFRRSMGSRNTNVPTVLVGNPMKVSKSIFGHAVKRRNVVYVGRIWWFVMFIICKIPESIFKRLNL